ncbi:hypothetical protein [Nocardia sp. NPDC005366]|uniref:hypothetical protein n=1 Tax=Nocardia sp. NPDC005366 TaxID=3156878 RepID=UPI00339E98A5
MPSETPDYRELVSAAFAGEAADGGLDAAVLRRIRAGDFGEWLTALDHSGLFGQDALAKIAEQWRADPTVLLDALLADADIVTRRRTMAEWTALDRPETRTRLG